MFSLLKDGEKPLDNISESGGYTSIFRTVCCIGDSLSSGEFESRSANGDRGWHDMFEYSWGQYMARMCGFKAYNFSRGGMTARVYCESFADKNGFWNPDYASQCYIIALGVNDILNEKGEVGSLDDIKADYRQNARNFAGYYAEIVARLKEIQPRAKFFFMTMPKDTADTEEKDALRRQHRKLLYDLAEHFDNSYVIDLYEYAPVYDDSFKKSMFLLGHMSPMGYVFTAKTVASYIDYIIRSHPEDFKEVPFIGTDLHANV